MGKLNTSIKIIRAYKTWLKWFLVYFNILKGKEYILKTRSGERFIVRTKKGDIHPLGDVYHLEEYKRLPIYPSDIVIDIGAHCGFFSVYAAKRAKQVFSFEPVAETFAALKRNIRLNRAVNVVAVNKGVSSRKGEAKIYLSDKSGHNSMVSTAAKTKRCEKIELTTLKDIFLENKIKVCGYLKIDCEGAEFDIMMSLNKKYLSRIKRIAMEYHDGPEFRRNKAPRLNGLISFLGENGFKVRVKPHPVMGNQFGMLYACRR